MTAVLEPQQSERTALTPLAVPAGTPIHCGTAMVMGAAPLESLLWAHVPSGLAEWTCRCGFRLDADIAADPLSAVRMAAARVESLQWELDAAQERFEKALRSAAELGAGHAALGLAAGLPAAELDELLQ